MVLYYCFQSRIHFLISRHTTSLVVVVDFFIWYSGGGGGGEETIHGEVEGMREECAKKVNSPRLEKWSFFRDAWGKKKGKRDVG